MHNPTGNFVASTTIAFKLKDVVVIVRSVEHQHCVKSHLITSEYGILAAVTKWTSLQRLTLAGISPIY